MTMVTEGEYHDYKDLFIEALRVIAEQHQEVSNGVSWELVCSVCLTVHDPLRAFE